MAVDKKTEKMKKDPKFGGTAKAVAPKGAKLEKAVANARAIGTKPASKSASAKKPSYVGNVVKEVKQTVKAVSNAVDKADRSMLEKKTGRKIDMKIGKSKIKEQVGQAAGAVLQGRRYDDKTGKQIKATVKKKGM